MVEENEKSEKIPVGNPDFLDGSYIFLPGQVQRIGSRLQMCEEVLSNDQGS